MWCKGGMQIKVYHNLETDFLHAYRAGQELKLVDTFDVGAIGEVNAQSPIEDILARVYRIHQAVDGSERNVKLKVRSLSMGDVIEVDEARYAVATKGFAPIAKEGEVLRFPDHDYPDDMLEVGGMPAAVGRKNGETLSFPDHDYPEHMVSVEQESK